MNSSKTGNNTVFLTLVGGGVFGNETAWIVDSLQRALDLYKHAALDVAIVSYKWSNPDIQHLVSHTDTSEAKKSQLYSSLWQSCDELRGGMDAS